MSTLVELRPHGRRTRPGWSRKADGVTIDSAGARDLAALLAIDVALTDRERQDEILRTSVGQGGCFVARDGAIVAGFLTWDLGFFHRPFVRLLVVADAYRRRGLARALLGAAEGAASSRGELFVSTEAINAPMQALLARAGYKPSGSIDNLNAPGNAELLYYKRLV